MAFTSQPNVSLEDIVALTSYDQQVQVYIADAPVTYLEFEGEISELGELLDSDEFSYLTNATVASISAKTIDGVLSIGIKYITVI